MGGQMTGQKTYLDVALSGLLIEGTLKAQFDLMKLLNEDSKLEVSPNIGVAAGYYTSEITRESTGAPVDNSFNVNLKNPHPFSPSNATCKLLSG